MMVSKKKTTEYSIVFDKNVLNLLKSFMENQDILG